MTVGYHESDRAKNSVKLFVVDLAPDYKECVDAEMEELADRHFEIRESNYKIPARETEYQYVCKTYE
jgi:hypothetical protein